MQSLRLSQPTKGKTTTCNVAINFLYTLLPDGLDEVHLSLTGLLSLEAVCCTRQYGTYGYTTFIDVCTTRALLLVIVLYSSDITSAYSSLIRRLVNDLSLTLLTCQLSSPLTYRSITHSRSHRSVMDSHDA